ncbi:MAG: DegT/DnrJ/EryC1/StrS family aminotransferase [Alphaproteobacteria bacterium]|nr:DegT/DnrJ/EryC1/StrS family aminotransferase [Alphaproteobacteria bacterium]
MSPNVPFFSLREAIAELRPELDAAYQRVMASGMFIRGNEVAAFEDAFAAAAGAAHAVGTGNGLDALTLVLRSLGIGPGDEIVTPCHTFIATWLSISATGATPVPVDVDPTTWTVGAEAVEGALSEKTRAVIPVHIYGHPVDMDPINDLCRPRRIAVIEDAAQGHGARYKGRRVGSLGHAAAFSFYPTKNLGAFGDGGAVTTDDGDMADRVRLLGNYGSADKDHFEARGANSRLDELQAAFLRVRLDRLEGWNARRQRIAERYLGAFADLPLVLPPVAPWAEPVWHLFVIRHPRRDALADFLKERGIATQVHYPVPPHLQKAYGDLSVDGSRLAVSEALAREGLSLPIWPHMGEDMVERVVEAVREFCLSDRA